MAMKKAEMERHSSRYIEMLNEARTAIINGNYEAAVQAAIAACDYIDGMMRYQRRYENREFTSVDSIDIVLSHSPFLLDGESIEHIGVLLKNQRHIERNTSHKLSAQLEEARLQLNHLFRLWVLIEKKPGIKQDSLASFLGHDQIMWQLYAERWESMGIIDRETEGRSYRLTLRTRLEDFCKGKCSSCGDTTNAPKSMYLEPLLCANCQSTCLFIITG